MKYMTRVKTLKHTVCIWKSMATKEAISNSAFQHTPPLWRDLVKILTTKPSHTSYFSLEKFPEPFLRSPRLLRSKFIETENEENYK
jgi:hypothetical protein